MIPLTDDSLLVNVEEYGVDYDEPILDVILNNNIVVPNSSVKLTLCTSREAMVCFKPKLGKNIFHDTTSLTSFFFSSYVYHGGINEAINDFWVFEKCEHIGTSCRTMHHIFFNWSVLNWLGMPFTAKTLSHFILVLCSFTTLTN